MAALLQVPGLAAVLLADTGSRSDERIMRAASRLMASRGVEVTIDEVAQESGMSRATVFRRFGSKDELLERSLRREIRLGVQQILARADQRPTAVDRAVELIASAFEVCVTHPVVTYLGRTNPGRLISLVESGDPAPLQLVTDVFAVALRLAVAETATTPIVDPATAAAHLMRLVTGYVVLTSSAVELEPAAIHSSVEPLVRALLSAG